MPLVVDASVTASWGLADEEHPVASRAFEILRQQVETWAPWVWWFEVRNTLIVAERRHRIEPPDVAQFLSRLNRLPVLIDDEPREADVMHLARRHRLSVYDAAYLELAQRKGASLATLDGALATSATEAGLTLV